MKKLYISISLLAAILSGCIKNEYVTPQPVIIIILDDRSMSADKNSIPQLKEADINMLVNLVSHTGGELCYLPVADNSFIPIIRLNLESIQGTLKEKAVIKQKQQENVELFKEKVIQIINSKRRAKMTDFWGSIKRADRLFQEAQIDKSFRKVVLCISDFEDDASRYKSMTLQPDVTFIAVGIIDEQVAQKVGSDVLIFEGTNSALRYIDKLVKGDDNVSI